MSTPSKVTSPRRKTVKVIPNVVANIVFINPEIRKQQAYKDWQTAL